MKILFGCVLALMMCGTAQAGGWERTEAHYETAGGSHGDTMRRGQQRRADRRARRAERKAMKAAAHGSAGTTSYSSHGTTSYGSSGSTSYQAPVEEAPPEAPQASCEVCAPVVVSVLEAPPRQVAIRRTPIYYCPTGVCHK